MDHFYIITGGPGSGKTSLLNALALSGYQHSQEAGRHIIQDQVAIGGTALPWLNPSLFAELMLAWEMRSYTIAINEESEKPYFFDRGIADISGYLALCTLPVPAHMSQAVQRYSYNRTVFIAPHWPEIYEADEERKQSLDEAERTFDVMVSTYQHYGFKLLELPKADIKTRMGFVLNHIHRSDT